jgi:hypothetical protein
MAADALPFHPGAAPVPPTRLLLTPRETAKALAVCEKTLWSITAPRGPLLAVRIGRAVRYDLADLRAFIDGRKGAAHE